ncbi:MAG TPA: hypothetical protein VHW65_09815, partial [Gemmatimonadales bacterium]|nr:hypothetical protein [Gemmatimonadales bacterium]
IGLTDLIRTWLPRLRRRSREAILGVYAVALIPLVANFPAATRRQIPDATFARDFAVALLQSVPQNGILFTWGDNDTFPLWYAQAVEGIRTDVTVVCLALAETPWYLKEMRNGANGVAVHDLSDSVIDNFRPFRPDRDVSITLPNGDVATIPAGTAVYGRDLLVLHVLELNAGKRSLAWSVTDRDVLFGLEPHLVQQGMALVMPAGTVLGTAGGAGRDGSSLDVATTRWLADSVWQYGRMLKGNAEDLDPDVRALADMMAVPMAQAGRVLLERGDTAEGVALLRRAVQLAADSSAEAALRGLSGSGVRQ